MSASPSADILKSPSQGTLWDTATLVAKDPVLGDVVRGEAGIHASWSRKGDCLETWPRGQAVLGRVLGYGTHAAGPEGWRAERVTIDRLLVCVPDGANRETLRVGLERAERLSARYGVPVGVARRPQR
jgi:hypothetical protein